MTGERSRWWPWGRAPAPVLASPVPAPDLLPLTGTGLRNGMWVVCQLHEEPLDPKLPPPTLVSRVGIVQGLVANDFGRVRVAICNEHGLHDYTANVPRTHVWQAACGQVPVSQRLERERMAALGYK